MESYKLLYF